MENNIEICKEKPNEILDSPREELCKKQEDKKRFIKISDSVFINMDHVILIERNKSYCKIIFDFYIDPKRKDNSLYYNSNTSDYKAINDYTKTIE